MMGITKKILSVSLIVIALAYFKNDFKEPPINKILNEFTLNEVPKNIKPIIDNHKPIGKVITVDNEYQKTNMFIDKENDKIFESFEKSKIYYSEKKEYFYVAFEIKLKNKEDKEKFIENIYESHLNHTYKEIEIKDKGFFYFNSKQKSTSFKSFVKGAINLINNKSLENEDYKDILSKVVTNKDIPFEKYSIIIKYNNEEISYYFLPTIYLSNFN